MHVYMQTLLFCKKLGVPCVYTPWQAPCTVTVVFDILHTELTQSVIVELPWGVVEHLLFFAVFVMTICIYVTP